MEASGDESRHISHVGDERIRAEQVALLYQQSGTVLAATLILAGLVAFLLWDVVNTTRLTGWLSIYVLVTLIRAAITASYLTRTETARIDNHRTWGLIFIGGVVLAGLTWGGGAVVLFEPDAPVAMLSLTCLYSIVVAVAAQPLGSYLPAFLSFSACMILPLMGQLIVAGGDLYRPIGLTGFLYLAAITSFAYNTNKTIISSIALRFENLDLVERLSAQKTLAEEATVAKSKFLAAASHDLRQPLHALGLFHDALEPHVDARGTEIMGHIKRSIAALVSLFDRLLDISRLDAGVVNVSRQNFELMPILERIIREYEPRAAEKGLALRLSARQCVVDTDPILLERILRNLVSNAIRYTDTGSITLDCEINASRVHISVRDTGRGIDTTELENIFSEYHQLDNPERDRTKGLGLGLSIVRRLSRLLGSEIQVESFVGKGSVFSIDVPLGTAESLQPAESAGAWDLRGSIIIVIDDEAEIRESMGYVLQRWGCEPILAESIDEAITLLDQDIVPSAVVADYRLRKNATGIEAIQKLREQFGHELPAILISGDSAPELLQEVEASRLRLLHKPVMAAELRNALTQEMIASVN